MSEVKAPYLLIISEHSLDNDNVFWRVARDGCGIDTNYVKICNASKAKKYILHYRPDCILAFGNYGASALGLEGTLKNLRDEIQEVEVDIPDKKRPFKSKVVVAWSPTFIEQAPNNLIQWAKDILRAWNISQGVSTQAQYSKYKLVTTMKEVRQVIEYIKETGECTFDFETNKLEDIGTFDVDFFATCMSVSFQHGSAYVIPLFHWETPFTEDQIRTIFTKFSEEIWQNPDITKINHNIKFDMHVAAHYGFPIFRGRLVDTMLQHHLLTSHLKHGLKIIIPQYFPQFDGYEEEVAKHKWDEVPLEILAPYAATDADLTLRLYTIQEFELLKDRQLYTISRNQSSFCIRPLFYAEREGMLVDRETLLRNSKRAKELLDIQEKVLLNYSQVKRYEITAAKKYALKKIAKLEQHRETLKTEAGKEKTNQKIREYKTGQRQEYPGINMSAPEQVGQLLYSKEGFNYSMPYVKKYKGKHPSTEQKHLKILNDHSGFIKDLMIYRAIDKNITTYLDGFLPLLDKVDRIHTSFLISGTVTGRLASKNPNLQNVTKHVKVDSEAVEEVVKMIMGNFVAPPGYTIMQGDFSQAELRIVADLAKEKNMIKAYRNDLDLHIITAANILNKSLDEFMELEGVVRDKWRSRAKAANFGLIYGQSPEGFRDYAFDKYGVVLTLDEARDMRDRFFAAYPALSDYHERYILKARTHGYVRTMFGRKRYAPNIKSDDDFLRGSDEREAINHPVQGTCGEMTILAFSLLQYRLPDSVKFVNTVHDSIVFYVPHRLVPYVAEVIKHTCENLPTKKYFGRELEYLKLKADIEVSTSNWKQLKSYDKDNWIDFWQKGADNQSYYQFINDKKKKKEAV